MLGIDVSRWQPIALPWPAWVAAGLQVAVVQVTHGTAPEPHAAEHLAAAVAAGVPHLGAYHYLLPGNARAQFFAFLDALDHHYSFSALDVEEPGVTANDVLEWCQFYETEFTGHPLPLDLYGNNQLAAIIAAHPELRRYGAWWANYPAGKARIAAPPAGSKPSAPAGLRVVGWQFTGTGLLPPYADNIDLTEWYEIPGAKPMTVSTSTGPKLGIHSIKPGTTIPLVRQAITAGWHWPLVKILHDASVCSDVKAISPKTLTICRYMPPSVDDEGLQGVEGWTLERMQAWAKRLIDNALARTAASDLPHVDYFDPTNEPDPAEGEFSPSALLTARAMLYPSGALAYAALGLAFCELVRRADAAHIHLSLPAFPQGVPEYTEMVALVETGLFGLMKKGGHIFDVHEGVFTDQPIDYGYRDVIPGAPVVAGAGSTNFRHKYLYRLLADRGETVPLVISEFYGGGRYSNDPADQVARFAWYDQRARQEPYLLAFCPFTLNSDAGWANADYGPTYASAELWNYIAAEKDKPNHTENDDMPNVSDADFAALMTANAQQAAILAKYKPASAKHTLAGKTNQFVIDLFHKTFNGYVALDAVGGVTKLVNLGRQAPYTGPALEDAPLTPEQLAALIAGLA